MRTPRMSLASFLVWELPFWIILPFWTIVPTTVMGVVTYNNVPFRPTELLLIALSGYYCLTLFAISVLQLRGDSSRDSSGLIRVLLLSVLYAWISLIWSTLGGKDSFPMTYALVGAAATIIPSYCLISRRTRSEVDGFLIRLTWYLCGISLIYFLESFLNMGLRSAEGRDVADFGIQRVKGPLYEASTGHILLVPCLGFCLSRLPLSSSKVVRTIWVLCSLIFCMTCIGLGSRAAILVFACFSVASILTVKGFKSKFLFASFLIVMAAPATLVVFSKASTERLQSFEDDARGTTYETSLRIYFSSWHNCIVGAGYGSIWPWYLTDRLEGSGLQSSDAITRTSFGEVLYQPHSTLVFLAVELGTVGIAVFFYLFYLLCDMIAAARKRSEYVVFAIGLATSGLALLFDLFLFKCWLLSSLWLIYILGCYKLVRR